MAADIKAVAAIIHGAGDAPDIFGVGFEDENRLAAFAQFIGGGEASGSGSDDDSFVLRLAHKVRLRQARRHQRTAGNRSDGMGSTGLRLRLSNELQHLVLVLKSGVGVQQLLPGSDGTLRILLTLQLYNTQVEKRIGLGGLIG